MKKDPVIEKLEEHDAHLESIEKRMATKDQVDRLTKTVIDHGNRLERIESTMATKDQFEELKSMVGEVLVTVKRLDQERKVMAGSIMRIHDKDAEQDTEIMRIKTHVGMK